MKYSHILIHKKSILLEKLIDLKAQIWITATEKEKFLKTKKNFCHHHLTETDYNMSIKKKR